MQILYYKTSWEKVTHADLLPAYAEGLEISNEKVGGTVKGVSQKFDIWTKKTHSRNKNVLPKMFLYKILDINCNKFVDFKFKKK